MTLTLLASTALCVAALPLAGPAAAQEQSDDRGQVVLDPITITAWGQLPPAHTGGQVASGGKVGVLGNLGVMETPFATVSYTQQRIADTGAQNVSTLISKTDPSVQVSDRMNIYESFYIRGFSTSATDFMFNGLVGMAPNLRSSVGFAERIELLKGPSTLLTGMLPGGSVAGTVNIVPKRAQDDGNAQVTASFDSESQWGLQGDFGRRFGADKQWGIRVNGQISDGDTAVDDETHGLKNAAVALDYRGDRLRFSLDYYKQREDFDGVNYFGLGVSSAVTSLPKPRNGSHSLAAPWAFNTNDTETLVLRGEYDLSDAVTAYAGLGVSTGGYDALITGSTLLNDAGAVNVNAVRQATSEDRLSGEIGLRGHLMTGGVSHNWTLSANRFKSENQFKFLRFNSIASTNLNDLDFGTAPVTTGFDDLDMMAQIDTTLTSYALTNTMGFADNRLLVTLGARYQRVENKQYYLANGFVASDYDDHRVSPAVAVVYKLSDTTSVYANYIEGLSQGGIAPATAANAYQAMAPYKTTQYEAGIKWEQDNLLNTVSLFQIEKPNGYTDPDTNVYGVYGQQRNRGIEFTSVGEVMPGLRLLGGLAYTQAKLTATQGGVNDGKKAAGVAPFSARLGLEYDVTAVQGLTIGGNVNFVSKRYINSSNDLSVPARTTVDLAARYTTGLYGEPLTIRAGVQNVTNEDYWDFDSFGGSYGNPRTFALSITKNF